MDKQELIASLLMVGFTDLSSESMADTCYWDVIEPHGNVYVDLDDLYELYRVNPNRHIVAVEDDSQRVNYRSYQEAWNHIKTLLPKE